MSTSIVKAIHNAKCVMRNDSDAVYFGGNFTRDEILSAVDFTHEE